MKIVPRSRNEEIVQIVLSWQSLWILFFHYGNQIVCDFIEFIFSEQIGYFSGTEHIVQKLQKCLILYVVIGKDECDSVTFQARHPVQVLEIVLKITHAVTPGKDLTRNV